ncbi:MAG: hemolysin family protein [Bacteroidia bacterium]
MDTSLIPVILVSILISAFFSGIEIAFISANKLLIELKSKHGSISAKILSPFVNSPSKFISTTLVGNNVGLVIYGIYMADFLEPLLRKIIPYQHHSTLLLLFISTIVSTLIVLVTAEFIPKMLFRINPDIILNFFALPFLIAYYVFWPLVHFIMWLARLILNNLFRLNFTEVAPGFNKVDLDQYVTESVEDIHEEGEVDTEIFKNALDFANVKVRDCMTPRTELVSVSVDSGIRNLYLKFVETGLSKILVHEGNIDHITGYVHQKDIFQKPGDIRSILIPIEVATEALPANELLNTFTKTHKSISLVVDELGVTAGIVTIEDIMEEIFGEIEDEHDVEQLTEKQLTANEFLFNTRLETDYLNSKYDLRIPEGDYQTLGGFITSMHGNIPQRGESIEIGRFQFTILSTDKTKINEVRMKITGSPT